MAISASDAPTVKLPPIRQIKSTSIADLLDAIQYLTLLYNPEIRGSCLIDKQICPLHFGARPRSPRSPRRSLDALKYHVDTELTVIRADSFERAYAMQWLTAVVSQAMYLEEDSEHVETLVQDAASLIAICAGAASAGIRSRIFTFSNALSSEKPEIKVRITDLPLDNQDYSTVGAQTWGGACLLADMITQSPPHFGLPAAGGRAPRILELGAGTGLVGLAVGKLLSSLGTTAEIVTTDFQPAVLKNLSKNIAANFLHPTSAESVSITSHFLEWSNPPTSATPPFDKPFDIIYGADIIYELEHALWIKTCVERFLRKPSLGSLEFHFPPETPTMASVLHPRFHLVLPLRATHSAESMTIEEVFPFAPSVCAGWDSSDSDASSAHDLTLAITAKEDIVCRDAVWSNDAREVEYIHYVISWI
ncbi:putative methyltransferase-domain-containing protein [Cytidiella melzeri]|nr:putative methyltransferase-domain-containing protein [Cytidiella melzeri]